MPLRSCLCACFTFSTWFFVFFAVLCTTVFFRPRPTHPHSWYSARLPLTSPAAQEARVPTYLPTYLPTYSPTHLHLPTLSPTRLLTYPPYSPTHLDRPTHLPTYWNLTLPFSHPHHLSRKRTKQRDRHAPHRAATAGPSGKTPHRRAQATGAPIAPTAGRRGGGRRRRPGGE